jgi:hypothetical protein
MLGNGVLPVPINQALTENYFAVKFNRKKQKNYVRGYGCCEIITQVTDAGEMRDVR